MNILRRGLSASSGAGGRRSTKLAMTPSRKTIVAPVARICGQNSSVRKRSTTATEPPWISIAKRIEAPPTWNIGMLTMNRSSAPKIPFIVSEANISCVWIYEVSTPFEGPVVPDV